MLVYEKILVQKGRIGNNALSRFISFKLLLTYQFRKHKLHLQWGDLYKYSTPIISNEY